MTRPHRTLTLGAAALLVTVAAALVMTGCGNASAGGGSGGGSAGGPDDAVAAGTRTSVGVASFEGTVSDATGQPVVGVMLTANSLASPPLPVPELAVVTDDRGHYSWHGLRPGPYAVSASHGAATARIVLSVVDGKAAVGDLVLR